MSQGEGGKTFLVFVQYLEILVLVYELKSNTTVLSLSGKKIDIKAEKVTLKASNSGSYHSFRSPTYIGVCTSSGTIRIFYSHT